MRTFQPAVTDEFSSRVKADADPEGREVEGISARIAKAGALAAVAAEQERRALREAPPHRLKPPTYPSRSDIDNAQKVNQAAPRPNTHRVEATRYAAFEYLRQQVSGTDFLNQQSLYPKLKE